MLAPWKKSYYQLRQHIKKKRHYFAKGLSNQSYVVQSKLFPIVIYGYESWTIKKAECRRIDAFELWCWRRLLSPHLLFLLSAPKFSWGRPASQTRKMLGSWHSLSDSLVPRYGLAQGCPNSHWAPLSPSPTTLPCYPSGPCLSALPQTTFIPRVR